MGGFFGVVSNDDCVTDLFYGTDYHSHLGTRRGGLAVLGGSNRDEFTRYIHDISNAQFKSKFEHDVGRMHGNSGLGIISDYEDQPLIVGSHLGVYAIVTVGLVSNARDLARSAYRARTTHFSEMSGNEINQTELVATLINQEATFQDGIRSAQQQIEGSCSLMLLTPGGIYAARDRLGRTPVTIARSGQGFAAASESCALPNLGYEAVRDLGPGEVVLLTPDGCSTVVQPGDEMQICSFLWVYYGYPASVYEGVNVEQARYRCGAALAAQDREVDGGFPIDSVAGIPDSGTSHALGYSHEARVPFTRPFVKYTPTWPRSFMPPNQETRDVVARMKLIPVKELAEGKRHLFCDDSIVRGTQLGNTFQRLYEMGTKEIHLRIACPPLLYGCPFLNFSRSSSELELAARKAVQKLLGGDGDQGLSPFSDPKTEEYSSMVEHIAHSLGVTSLRYQPLDAMIRSIGLPRRNLCTHCWTGPHPTRAEMAEG